MHFRSLNSYWERQKLWNGQLFRKLLNIEKQKKKTCVIILKALLTDTQIPILNENTQVIN